MTQNQKKAEKQLKQKTGWCQDWGFIKLLFVIFERCDIVHP